MASPLSQPEPWSLVSTGYVKYTQPFLEQFSRVALELLDLQPTDLVLDAAAGPGTTSLLMAPTVAEVHAVDFSPAMVDALKQAAGRSKVSNIRVKVMDGQRLEYASEMFDAYVSMFGLIFFPSFHKGLEEALRVLKPEGKLCFSTWAPAAESPLMSLLFDTLEHANPDFKRETPDPDSLMFEPVIRRRLENAGMTRIEIHSCSRALPMQPDNAVDFWGGAVEGSAPLAMMRSSMPAAAWAEVEKKAVAYLESRYKTGMDLTSRAWIATARKAG